MKRMTVFLMSLTLILSLAACGGTGTPSSTPSSTPDTSASQPLQSSESTASEPAMSEPDETPAISDPYNFERAWNSAHNSVVARLDDRYFYLTDTDVYSCAMDGSDHKKLYTGEWLEHLCVYDGSIYFTEIGRLRKMKPDGSELKAIEQKAFSLHISGGHVFTGNLSTSGLLWDTELEFIREIPGPSELMAALDGKLYYVLQNRDSGNCEIFEYDPESDSTVSLPVPLTKIYEMGQFYVDADYYYILAQEEGDESYNFCVISRETGELEKKHLCMTSGAVVIDGTVYALLGSEGLVELALDGSVIRTLDAAANYNYGPFLVGDFIGYIDGDSGAVALIKPDGSGKMLLNAS